MNEPHAGSTSASALLSGPWSGGGTAAAWVLSVAVHALALGIMLYVVFPFAVQPTPSEIPVLHAQIIGDVDVPLGATAWNPSQTPPSTVDPRQAEVLPTPRPVSEVLERLAPGSSGSTRGGDISIIGMGSAGGIGTGVGLGPGRSDGDGMGLKLGEGGGPEFFGVGGSVPGVRKIVYVVDRSGSMVDTFKYVQAELKRSVSALRRSQKFHVIFFNASEPLENPPLRLVNAIEAHKSEFFRFLETVHPQGGTKPERALRIALALEPDILYLLSDGINFDPTLMQKLHEWNPQRRTRIFTIAYLDQTGRQILETVAREHEGECKFVSEDELP